MARVSENPGMRSRMWSRIQWPRRWPGRVRMIKPTTKQITSNSPSATTLSCTTVCGSNLAIGSSSTNAPLIALNKSNRLTSRAELLPEFQILRVIHILRLLFRVKVIKISKKLVEPVLDRQELILVAKVIFPELPCRISERFEHFRDRRILLTQTDVRTRQANFR